MRVVSHEDSKLSTYRNWCKVWILPAWMQEANSFFKQILELLLSVVNSLTLNLQSGKLATGPQSFCSICIRTKGEVEGVQKMCFCRHMQNHMHLVSVSVQLTAHSMSHSHCRYLINLDLRNQRCKVVQSRVQKPIHCIKNPFCARPIQALTCNFCNVD